MAIQTTTFKGARYIVKFHDPIAWSLDETYEAIEAVQHNGFTYISKQPVPVGVQIDNDAFWLVWADPNAQMEQLRQLVSQYVDNVEELSGVVGDLNSELATEIQNRESADTAIRNEMALDIEKAHVFDTVANMKASLNLSVGAICHTNGFYAAGDGGAAWYEITNSGTANEMDVIACGDLFATLVVPEIVTPEMFGAYGDGTNDDTDAVKRALSFPKVMFNSDGEYVIGQIDIENNVDVDFNNCKIISDSTWIFNIESELVNTVAGSNYNAFETYTIGTFNGLVVLHGTNTLIGSRPYYKCGFTAMCENGRVMEGFPIPVTSPTIYEYDPLNVSFKNLAEVEFNGENQILFRCLNIADSEFDNIRVKGAFYSAIYLAGCYQVIARNCNIYCENAVASQPYAFEILDSSYISVYDSVLYCDKWHALATGGEHLVYKCSYINCTFDSQSDYAYGPHDNEYGQFIDNCVFRGCIGVGPLGVAQNSVIYPGLGGYYRTQVRIYPSGFDGIGNYTIKHITMVRSNSNTNIDYYGIDINISPQNISDAFNGYINNVVIDNVKCSNNDFSHGSLLCVVNVPGTYDNISVGRISISNSDMCFKARRDVAEVYITNCKIYNYVNTTDSKKINYLCIRNNEEVFSGLQGYFGTVIMEDCNTGSNSYINSCDLLIVRNSNLRQFNAFKQYITSMEGYGFAVLNTDAKFDVHTVSGTKYKYVPSSSGFTVSTL